MTQRDPDNQHYGAAVVAFFGLAAFVAALIAFALVHGG